MLALAGLPLGHVINYPFYYQPKDPPEFNYRYFFDRVFHGHPIVNGVDFKNHNAALQRMGANNPNEISQGLVRRLQGSGVKYILIHHTDSWEINHYRKFLSLQEVGLIGNIATKKLFLIRNSIEHFDKHIFAREILYWEL